MQERSHLAIGEVLSLLRDEFPDVTISKIRFLESQGLVDPERTPSGYRKFYDADVERLRWILLQQKEHFLPLKVIKDRLAELEAAGIEPTPELGGAPVPEEAERRLPLDEEPPAAAEPVAAEPAPAEPKATEPAAPEPVAPEPVAPEPVTVEPVTVEPVTIDVEPAAPVGGPAEPAPITPVAVVSRVEAAPTEPLEAAVPAVEEPVAEPEEEARETTLPEAGDLTPAPSVLAPAHTEGEEPAPAEGPAEAAQEEVAEQPETAVEPLAAESAAERPVVDRSEVEEPPVTAEPASPAGRPSSPSLRSREDPETMTLEELAVAVGLEPEAVTELQQFGLITPSSVVGGTTYFDQVALQVARIAAAFGRHGVEARHLRSWRNSAEREVSIFEQVVMPMLRQRNPQARGQAEATLAELAGLGADLRGALVRQAFAPFAEPGTCRGRRRNRPGAAAGRHEPVGSQYCTDMLEMRLAAVRVELPGNTPILLLQETGGAKRTLPIYIGTAEAQAIAYSLQGVETPRPMTHDLMRDLLGELGATVECVVITELREGTFYAEIRLRSGGQRRVVSARPSDAVALAVRVEAPLYAVESLVDAEGYILAEDAEEQASEESDELLEQFRDFIDGIKPEDF